MFSRSKSYSGRSSHSPRRAASVVSTGEGRGFYTRPTASKSSSSLLGESSRGRHEHSSSSRGIFGFGSSGSGSSYYKRRPRDGYIAYLMHRLSRMIKELWYYARRHPVKAFFAVIVPLLSAGGALTGLLRQFNVRVPGMSGSSIGRGGGGYYGSSGYGGSSMGRGSNDWMGNANSLMQIAKAFM